ncbi:hypothetical protein [Chryseolinea lacunae]|uniref:Uncharacterized protein n=1 Tax=Chryseolinea lacunae TaxID=2801331 RepID=A0ABS1KUP0_9BACT|nr:hypothetical protein [Chryseolinea lacunae]MBL0743193.1 hypothetical protein [Chryseolinea lacunae]
MTQPTRTTRREAQLTRRFPILTVIPDGERLHFAKMAGRHPMVWGTGLLVFFLLLPLQARGIGLAQHFLEGMYQHATVMLVMLVFNTPLLWVMTAMQAFVIKRMIGRRTNVMTEGE